MLLHKGNRGIRHIVSTTNSQKIFMYFIKSRSPRAVFLWVVLLNLVTLKICFQYSCLE